MAYGRRNRKRNQSARTQFTPKNPSKYKGTYPIWMRSRWEIGFAINCDENPNVLEWASEPVQIPYADPTSVDKNTGKPKQKVYVPDFLVKFVKTTRTRKNDVVVVSRTEEVMLIEIKPAHETYVAEARNKRDAEAVIKNTAKWQAASAWCARRNVLFKILTERDLFNQPKPKPRARKA